MRNKELLEQLRELDRLYAEHAGNQRGESLQAKNKVRLELLDKFLLMKPYIKKKTRLQWYDPVYTYAITGNLDYIETARKDLAEIIRQYAQPEFSESS